MATAAPVYDSRNEDPHFHACDTLVNAPDAQLDSITMPNVAFRLSTTRAHPAR